ncbi:cytochrome c551/c552 [Wenyingzhuangia heitensis]|uniref:Cytochrome c551/c552 n=1 Tax=Wenyingzhuangia heitensis TaxID=1487859 RepID=A0ABX0UDL7_9FLAO|nr:c-type cytochrome [Wenyingzhuangia heitensis]NIJ45940.1 cytochrome c551/c552 [Wenyingzhuangia heitensis]
MKHIITSVFALLVIMNAKAQKKTEEKTQVVLSDEEIKPLLLKNACIGCHKKDKKLVGPAFKEIAKRNYSNERILELIYKPEPKNWPEYKTPMAPLSFVTKEDGLKLAAWINSLK